ncbi:MAG: hypothetical protein COV66_03685 [Nitrospinae bacterium CG11_big_fil_rev_8_21_14_0_20_45_15]|nr:MAG: hypothetical protein COV66_03685 [Nitrospinae bacterium CG11_big_fil_rev_8_21_14_0_20_45_15]
MKIFGKFIIFTVLAFWGFAVNLCTVEIVGAVPFISEETELTMGREADPQIIQQYGLYQDKKLQLYVNDVGQKLVSQLSDKVFQKYFFRVVNSSDINAFALPGGYIYITTGILATLNSEAELAGVLGHEIGHVIFHHGAKLMLRSIGAQILSLGGAIASPKNAGQWLMVSSAMFNQINLGYGREAELESDQQGMYNAMEAGYNPERMVHFLKNLRQNEIMTGQAYHGFQATHPDTKDRIIQADQFSSSLVRRSHDLKDKREDYLRIIKGLPYNGKRHANDQRYFDEKYIDIYEVQAGDTYTKIAERELKDPQMDLEIAVLNGMKMDDPLKPGELIKIIRKGVYPGLQIVSMKNEPDTTASKRKPASMPEIPEISQIPAEDVMPASPNRPR